MVISNTKQQLNADRRHFIGGSDARIIMGSLWGRTAPTTCHAETIYADIQLAAGASVPIDVGADERAIVVALATRRSTASHWNGTHCIC